MEEEEGNLRKLKTAIEQGTGKGLYGQPLKDLRSVAAACNGEVDELAAELEAMGIQRGGSIKFPPVLVGLAPALRAQIAEQEHEHRRSDLEEARRKVAWIESCELIDDPRYEAEYKTLKRTLSSLGADA